MTPVLDNSLLEAQMKQFLVRAATSGRRNPWTLRELEPPVAEGKDAGAQTSVAFTPTRVKFARLTQTETVGGAPNWAMSNLQIYEAGATK